MFDHIGLKIRDMDAAVRFWEAVLAPLGLGLCSRDDDSASFGPHGMPALWLYAGGTDGPGTHVALRARHRSAVDRFHAAALAAGGRDHGGPGVREAYDPRYYAAFVLDPDGNNVEAVCLG
ncbi:MAG: VOC family protein [Nannocystaceae bacterium]